MSLKINDPSISLYFGDTTDFQGLSYLYLLTSVLQETGNKMPQQEKLHNSPKSNDVVLGKGHAIQNRSGNKRYRSLILSMKADYDAAPKSMKSVYSYQIVSHIYSLNPPGKFLRKDKETQLWKDVPKKEAIMKVRQALRDSKPKDKTSLRGEPVVRRVLKVVTEETMV